MLLMINYPFILANNKKPKRLRMVNASRRHQRKTSRRTNNGNGDDDDNEDTDEYHSPEIGGEEIEEQELSGEDEDEYDGNEMKIDSHANLIE